MKTFHYFKQKKVICRFIFLLCWTLLISHNFAQSDGWDKKADIPTARSYAAACELDGKIYVIGGSVTNTSCLNVMEVYDPGTNTWDNSLTQMSTPRVNCCVAVVNGKIYVMGGTTGHTVSGGNLDVVEVYDPITDSWETKSPMPVARRAAACGVIDNKIYVAGGSPTSWYGTITNKLDVYDPASDTWDTTRENMPKSLFGPAGAVLDDKFYLLGGLHSSGWRGQKWLQIYDPITNNWDLGPNLINGRFDHSLEIVSGKLYAIGGTKTAGYGAIPTVQVVEVYDPSIDSSWSEVDTAPAVIRMHSSSVYDSIIYLFSGSNIAIDGMTSTSDVYSFEPDKVTSVSEDYYLQAKFKLLQNFPNPFNPNTTIKYSIPKQSNVTFTIFDVLGRELTTLVNKEKMPGNYDVEFIGSGLTSGIYFYRLQAGDFVETRKMILLK